MQTNTAYRPAGPSASAPGDASRTITITDAAPRPDDGGAGTNDPDDGAMGVLRLRGGPRNRQRVAWDEDVVDNEGCGRKSSKICCIYHKPRKFDESSSEDESDSDHGHGHDHRHAHTHPNGHNHRPRAGPGGDGAQMRPDSQAASAAVHRLDSDSDRNAYEVVPGSKKGKRKACAYLHLTHNPSPTTLVFVSWSCFFLC